MMESWATRSLCLWWNAVWWEVWKSPRTLALSSCWTPCGSVAPPPPPFLIRNCTLSNASGPKLPSPQQFVCLWQQGGCSVTFVNRHYVQSGQECIWVILESTFHLSCRINLLQKWHTQPKWKRVASVCFQCVANWLWQLHWFPTSFHCHLWHVVQAAVSEVKATLNPWCQGLVFRLH